MIAPAAPAEPVAPANAVVLSFDVEEHDRIEAAAGIPCPPHLRSRYAGRMEACTYWLLDELAGSGVRATFFVLGMIAKSHPSLVRRMRDEGHEVASHGWDHRRVHHFKPESFREDVRKAKDALEQAAGAAVVGYRAPTFSVMRQTAWAIDVLAEEGFVYDSSIFPVRHDRYGVPDAPRTPFRVCGHESELLELPPATLALGNFNLPVGGGGYFRLFPLGLLEASIRQLHRAEAGVAMFYFHPWEFDPCQPQLPLKRLSRWRTYVGIARSRPRLKKLMARHEFRRAVDVVKELIPVAERLPQFVLAQEEPAPRPASPRRAGIKLPKWSKVLRVARSLPARVLARVTSKPAERVG